MSHAQVLCLFLWFVCSLCALWRVKTQAHTVKSGGTVERPFYNIVNLVIYDERNAHEREMKSQLQRLLRDADHGSTNSTTIRQLFISCDPACADVARESGLSGESTGDMLHVGCEESYVPGILQKTVKSMQFCLETLDFDLLIRSNVSTVIDFGRLPMPELLTHARRSHGELLYASTSILHFSEQGKDDVAFASGTNIILNRQAVEHVVTHSDALDMQKPDDVAIGELFQGVATPHQTSTRMTWNDDDPLGVVFRNRDASENRSIDVRRMASIVNRIIDRNPLPRATFVSL
jgi:hypothetical protein